MIRRRLRATRRRLDQWIARRLHLGTAAETAAAHTCTIDAAARSVYDLARADAPWLPAWDDLHGFERDVWRDEIRQQLYPTPTEENPA